MRSVILTAPSGLSHYPGGSLWAGRGEGTNSAAAIFKHAKSAGLHTCYISNGNATPETFFKKLVAEFGASRIAWGSNYPASEGPLSNLLAVARASLASLPQADRDWVFAKTAQSLYPALAGS